MNAVSQEWTPDSQIHSASFLSFMCSLALVHFAKGDVVHRFTLDADATLLDFPDSITTIPIKPYKSCCLWQKTVDDGFQDFKNEMWKVL